MKSPVKVPYGYTFLGAYNTKKDAMRAIGKSAYKVYKIRHGNKIVWYAYVLR